MPPAKSPPRPAIPEELAIVPTAPDAISTEIEMVHQAIRETENSKDPVYVAQPWRRGRLLEELNDRIAHLKRLQASEAAAAAERAHKAQLQAAWAALGPEREAFVSRWNAARDEVRALLLEARRLQQVHAGTADRAVFNDLPGPLPFINARAELTDRHIVLRPDQLKP